MQTLLSQVITPVDVATYDTKQEDGNSFIIKANSTKSTNLHIYVTRHGEDGMQLYKMGVEANQPNDLIISRSVASLSVMFDAEKDATTQVQVDISAFKPRGK